MTEIGLVEIGIGVMISLQTWTLQKIYGFHGRLSILESKVQDHARRLNNLEN